MADALADRIRSLIRDVPDFPKPGILFKDITPIFADAEAFQGLIGAFADRYRALRPDAIVGIESRGFLVAAPLALALGCGTIIVRKPGKLPRKTRVQRYALEYGLDELHLHEDALHPDQNVIVVDDLLATGGTMRAACDLVEQAGARVAETAFIVELSFLKGRARVAPAPAWSLVTY
ncbi:MAG: adenine phosphoribosyltransferase [Myxococcales bacterium]|nr:adenine phosphoribosyltransferase [Myxococcales bacterium]